MKKSLLLGLALSTTLFSCGGNTEQGEGHEMDHSSTHETEATSSIPTETKATTAIINTYLVVKDALVGDDQATAAAKSKDLVLAIQSFDGGETLQELKEDALVQAENLSSGDIAAQRESFQALSITMKDLLKEAGTDRTLYQQYCPMYKNNSGGMWLSASEDIKNPLFGSSMLTCGKIEETIALN